ncbi:URM1 [Blepharisma stoltei]|uniref:Ubiquitin-related modifier 1 homolog n=1 Tax=Blepharisma stoltei TaxID=1481888 RepID=A0AAU9JQD1_9CILI|nr:unnamed protein product [Blepharisma stoltei]
MSVHIAFSGGLEDLFNKQRNLTVPLESQLTLKQLVFHLKDRYLQTRPELFMSGDSLRPGIIVLVNDMDWELCGKDDYVVQDRDAISFISTLHGG